jgi:pimeloyl-ACP methyl ester carboxylesterase
MLAGRSERIIAPINRIPSELRPMLAAIWTKPQFYQSLASQIRFMPESAAQVAATSIRPDLPLVVLSASSLPPGEIEQHRALASVSACGRHQIVPDSGHWIQLDQPEIVICAITELLSEISLI